MPTGVTDSEVAELLAGLRALGDGLAFNRYLGACVEELEIGRAVTRLADEPAASAALEAGQRPRATVAVAVTDAHEAQVARTG